MWSFRRLAAVWLLAGSMPLAAASIGFRTRALPLGAIGSAYRAVLETVLDGRCIDAGGAFALVDGALPDGLELRGNTITGVPEEFGVFPVKLQVSNECGVEERDFVVQVTGRPILRVVPDRIEAEYRADGPAPEVRRLVVSATWPGFRYSLVPVSVPWLKVRQQSGMTPRAGSPYAGDAVEVEFAPGKLAPGHYETELVFAGPQGAVPVTVPVRLRVAGTPAPGAPATVGLDAK